MSTQNGDIKAKRQCWECQKRRLVCDLTLPSCTKCIKAGKTCPGYNEQKPLRWNQTGQVTSKQKKKNAHPKIYSLSFQTKDIQIRTKVELAVTDAPNEVVMERNEALLDILSSKWGGREGPWTDKMSKNFQGPAIELYYEHVQALLDITFRQGKRRVVEEIVERGLRGEAESMLPNVPHPLKALGYLLQYVRSNDLPIYHGLATETSEVVQAIDYCTSFPNPKLP